MSGNCQEGTFMSSIEFVDRESGKLQTEQVYGEAALKFIYTNPFGRILSKAVALSPLSIAYGKLQDTSLSKIKVPKFIDQYNIPIKDYEPGSVKTHNIKESYAHFNEFFIRKFKAGARPFVTDNKLAAPAEARYVAYNQIDDNVQYPVKGKFLSATAILNSEKWGKIFEGGPLAIARLCPVDYHRYHYPDAGETIESYPVKGLYYSVNPMALKFKGEIFIQNERRVAILQTKNFGKIAYVEVGATMVGKIIQSHSESKSFERGSEKGYFLFGGSTVIILGEKGAWLPSKDLVENTSKGLETYVKIGTELGLKL
jgi:phosphatidylserine decarboxylase